MKFILILVLTTFSTGIMADTITACKGINCDQVQIENKDTESAGSELRNFQKSKLNGASQGPNSKSYLYNQGFQKTESSSFLKLTEINVGMCLVNPESSKTFYKVLEVDQSSGKIRFVIENEEHNYMLRGNVVFYQSDDSSAFKLLRRWPCNRTPNLNDNSYLEDCLKAGVKLGDIYCNPKSKLGL